MGAFFDRLGIEGLPNSAIREVHAGNNGIVFKAGKVLGGADRARVMAGPQAHWAKLAFERYFLASRKRRLVAP